MTSPSARPGITSAMKKRWRRTWRSRAVVTAAGVAGVAGGAIVISQIPTAAAKSPVTAPATAPAANSADGASAATTPTTAVVGQSKRSATAPTRSTRPVAPSQSTSSGS